MLAGIFQLLIALLKDGAMPVGKTVGRGDIAERAVETDLVVVVDEGTGDSFGVFEAQRCLWADGLLLEGTMEALDFAVALRIMRRAKHMGGLEVTDESFEVFCHELGAVVGDDSRAESRIGLMRFLKDDFRIGLLHRRADASANAMMTQGFIETSPLSFESFDTTRNIYTPSLRI